MSSTKSLIFWFLLVPTLALGQPAQLPESVPEGSTFYVRVRFEDRNQQLLVPESVKWWVFGADGARLQGEHDCPDHCIGWPDSRILLKLDPDATRMIGRTATETHGIQLIGTYPIGCFATPPITPTVLAGTPTPTPVTRCEYFTEQARFVVIAQDVRVGGTPPMGPTPENTSTPTTTRTPTRTPTSPP